VLVLVAGACRDAALQPAFRPALGPTRVERERALAELVDAERMAQHVRALVDLGPRMGGTRSGELAVRSRVAAFTALGLESRRIEAPAAWCHEEEAFSVRAHADGREVPLRHAWPWGFSPAARGRGRLVLEPAPGAVVLRAERPERGELDRAGAWLVDGVTTPDGSHPAIRDVRRGTVAPVFGLSRDEGALLRRHLEAGVPVEIEYALETTIREAPPVSVVASLPARAGAPPGYLLFCAHGDSDAGGPGANDNASGEAIVVEIARAWTRAIAEGLLPAPPREVRFAIWGSEIRSTRDFLAHHADDGGPILGVVNYDQAGFGSGAEQLNIEPDDLPANEGLVRTFCALLEEHAGEAGLPARFATNKSLGGTDSYVFSGSERFESGGRPAVTLFTSAWNRPEEHPRTPGMPGESWSDRDLVSVDYDNFYHSAGDTPENTTDREPWNMGWCARTGWLGALRWLDGLGDAP
jgi:hypothetical protein